MLRSLVTFVLDLVYPPRCVICHRILEKPRESVCPYCLAHLPEHDGAAPHIRYAEGCCVTLYYEDDVRSSFLRYKFEGLRHYAAVYGPWMANTIRDHFDGKYDLITWVPVSEKRRRTRGYDQSRLLAEEAARSLGKQAVQTLRKIVDTPAQSGLSDRSERAANVTGVYESVHPELFTGKRVLLVDDIVTTGATMSEACRVLLTSSAEAVYCAALATPRMD